MTAIQSKSYDLTDIGILLREVRSNCVGSFEVFEFSFCHKSCNKIAHELAEFERLAEEGCLGWANVTPNFVSDLVVSEIAAHVY
jgi:hypothetical protein